MTSLEHSHESHVKMTDSMSNLRRHTHVVTRRAAPAVSSITEPSQLIDRSFLIGRLHMTIGMTTGMHTRLQTRLRNTVYVFGHAHLHVYDAVSAACRWKRSTRSNIYI